MREIVPNRDEAFTAELIAYDAALHAGDSGTVDPAEDAELREAKACLERLESLWPRRERQLDITVQTQTTLPDLPPQVQLGRFRIVRELGRGGAGIVYLAYDPTLHRQVALKVPRPECLFTPELRRRFVREAEVAAQLNHRHIVPLHEAGEADGVCYLVSAYCPGPSLATWQRGQGGPVAARRAAQIVRALAEGVAHVHRRGILHRDIKPTNVMMVVDEHPDPGNELGFVPQLTDFGLAKLDDPGALLQGEKGMTRSGAILGTPAYMAPEQAEGRLDQIGPATDVYALGVVLYELLAGQPPFRGGSDVATLHQILSDEPSPLRRKRREVSRDLEAVCCKCLAKSPDGRYPTASALVDDLQRYLEGRSTQARPSGWFAQGWKWFRRKPTLAAAALATLVCVVVLACVPAWLSSRKQENELELQKVQKEVEYHKGQADELDWLGRNRHYVADFREAWNSWNNRQSARARAKLLAHRPAPKQKEVRGYEWAYLRRLARNDFVLEGHVAEINSLAYSENGRLIAAGARDSTTRVWDAETGRLLMTLENNRRDVQRLQFTANDTRLIAMAQNGEGTEIVADLIIWDLNTKSHHAKYGPYRHPFGYGLGMSISFAPDGSGAVVVKTGLSGGMTFVNLGTGVEKQMKLRGVIRGADISPRGNLVAVDGVVAHRCVIDLMELDTSEFRGTILLDNDVGGVYGMRFSPDGTTLAFVPRWMPDGPGKTPVEVWDINSRKLQKTLPTLETAFYLAFDPSQRWLAGANHIHAKSNSSFHLWNLATGQVLRTQENKNVNTMAFSPDGSELALAGIEAKVHLQETDPIGEAYSLPGPSDDSEAWSVAFSPDGARLAVGYDHTTDGEPKTLQIWNLHTRLPQILKDRKSMVMSVAWAADGKTLATGTHDHKVRTWDPVSGQPKEEFQGHAAQVRAVALSQNGKLLASAGKDRMLMLRDSATGKHIWLANAHTDTIRALAFAAQERLLISVGNDKTIKIWNAADLALVRSIADEHKIQCVAHFPIGGLIATGNENNQVKIWKLDDGSLLRTIEGPTGKVRAVAFAPDGRTLASGGEDNCVRLWHVLTGEELLAFPTEHFVNGLAFDAAGRNLAAALHNGTVKVWPASPGPDAIQK